MAACVNADLNCTLSPTRICTLGAVSRARGDGQAFCRAARWRAFARHTGANLAVAPNLGVTTLWQREAPQASLLG